VVRNAHSQARRQRRKEVRKEEGKKAQMCKHAILVLYHLLPRSNADVVSIVGRESELRNPQPYLPKKLYLIYPFEKISY
jgi:hypothetical protein